FTAKLSPSRSFTLKEPNMQNDTGAKGYWREQKPGKIHQPGREYKPDLTNERTWVKEEGPSPWLLAALDLAARGIPVSPCYAANKRPITENGFKDASTDP